MKCKFFIFLFICCCFKINAQCGISDFCNANTGIFSNDVATDIAYDNMGSSFHSTYIKEPNGNWKVWGESMRNNGNTNVLSPTSFNATNYPALTGTIYKMAIGSSYGLNVQLIVLTSDGLFVLGREGAVLDNSITSSTTFQKITVNGKTDGLPLGIIASDVKMLFASSTTLIITTCSGDVYVLSQNDDIRGDGGTGNSLQWSKVMINETTSLSNVIVARGNSAVGFALKSDGTIWTWGSNTYLGNGTAPLTQNFATQMSLPAGITGVKMIQSTNSDISGNGVSYYILGFDKKVYSLGNNDYGQLGDATTVLRESWVNAKNPDNSIITNAAWISANEHDDNFPCLALIKTTGELYTSGNNSYYMIGRINDGSIGGGINYLDLPSGVLASDVITFAETGGHTCALIKQCSTRYGYVGHRIRGSMGDGSTLDQIIGVYDFDAPPVIAVCGAQYVQPIITTNSPVCPNQNAIFTITSSVGHTLSYTINGGTTQTIVIGTSGTAQITIPNVTSIQTINFTSILSANTSCSYNLSLSTTVSLNIPIFSQVPPICEGQILNPLPLISNNGIVGTWSPAVNNTATTEYTFTPTINPCLVSTTMTIIVNPTNPIVALFTPIAPICEGDVLNPLPLISNNGISGTWSPALNNLSTTVYTFTPTIGSCINPIQLTINVSPKITPSFTQVGPICEGSLLSNLPTLSSNGIIGNWSPALNNLATTTYTFTPNSNECAFTNQMTIVVIPNVTPLFPSFNTLCFGDNQFILPTVSNNGITGTWSPSFNATQTTTYLFTPSIGQCALTASVEVPVFDDFDFDITTFCQSNNFFIQIQSNDLDVTTSTINWQFNNLNINSSTLFNVTSYLISTPITETFPLVFTITMTNANNCSKTKSFSIESAFCEIQNVITPNGDGLNDSFNLELLNATKLIIYNRWGVDVYNKEAYKNEWYGQSNSGKILPAGVYFYIIDLPIEDSKTGWILIRN